ncbi:DUF5994 family protein [Williamsia muralis]|uniref:Uncharacterized protein n=1 Tax=Williamsia marianensis TaxID=85044 RepID=A0A2G3PS68_WILMA|nr:DUF5994 family protein [Williamsia marianensis]PHV68645.1 hypothetical protein CSW57_05515 [Williamsia marianensis]
MSKPMSAPIRFTLARERGANIDGAWWPETARVGNELPLLVSALNPLLGVVRDVSVNWSRSDSFPDLDAVDYDGIRNSLIPVAQRIICLTGLKRTATLLVIPYRTSSALAVAILGETAGIASAGNASAKARVSARRIVREATKQIHGALPIAKTPAAEPHGGARSEA